MIARIQTGDVVAREQLVARFLPLLRRWAHGRLPANARGLLETGDLVQIALVRALDHLDTFVPRREGAFLAYLRRTLLNQMRNEIRRSGHDAREEISPDQPAGGPSLLEQIVDRDVIDAYEAGLSRLPPRLQEAVILSVEFGMSHKELAGMIGCPSANAARMVVSRAFVKLARAMDVEP